MAITDNYPIVALYAEDRIDDPEQASRALRLLNLYRVVKNYSDYVDRLGIHSWFDTHPCGTVGCLAGTAGLDPWFVDQGMSTNRDLGMVYLSADDPGRAQDFCSDDSGYRFFGLTGREGDDLFMPTGYWFGIGSLQDQALSKIADLLYLKHDINVRDYD